MFDAATSLELVEAGATRARRNGAQYVRLTRCQEAFLRCNAVRALWRDGNQLGKSLALAWLVIQWCRGEGYFRPFQPPLRVLVVGYSEAQMEPLAEKLWSLLPKDEIDPRNGFEKGRGITGKPPRILFVSGPGKGSSISFATYKQGAPRVAGGTFHLVILDEPPPLEIYSEVIPRLMRLGGYLRIGFTPVPDMPDQEWLREKCISRGGAAPEVREFNFHVRSENLWPQGWPAPWRRQWEIDDYEATLLPIHRGMRMKGDWEPVVTGRWLPSFGPDNVVDFSIADKDDVYWCVAVDHGATFGKQAAMLVAFGARKSMRPRVWFVDEYTTEDLSTPEQDAQAILAMLKRQGLKYDDVDEWLGDHQTRAKKVDIRKSNKLLRLEIARQLKRRVEKVDPIRLPRKFAGSVLWGCRLVNTLFQRRDKRGTPYALVHPRCVRFREACERFNGDWDDPVKDILDAGRYPVEACVNPKILPSIGMD